MRFDNGITMRLYRQTVEDFALYPGRELTLQEFEQLRLASSATSAKMRAVRIVAATSVSKKDLQRRLIAKGEDPTQAEAAVQWMSDLDLVDDQRVAEQIVSRCIGKGYGISRAKQMLYERQSPKRYWDEALQNYPDQIDAIAEYLRIHLGEDPDMRAKKRVIDALIRRGHPYSCIRKAMERLSYNADDIPEG